MSLIYGADWPIRLTQRPGNPKTTLSRRGDGAGKYGLPQPVAGV
jgi:hypothetical protein